MADYPSKVILGGGLLPSLSKNSSFKNGSNSSLNYAARVSSTSGLITGGVNAQSISKTRSQLMNGFPLLNIESLSKIYFNNGFFQDSQNIYLSKSALGLPVGFNLSLESFFVALVLQWLNRKQGSEQKIEVILVANGDKDGKYIYFTIQVIFKKELAVLDAYELQPIYTITPLDF